MYIHYCLRKSEYKSKKVLSIRRAEQANAIAEISDDFIKTLYAQVGAKNFEDFSKKTPDQNIIRSLAEQMEIREECRGSAIEETLKTSYFEEYNFKIYLATLLDSKFPDRGLESNRTISDKLISRKNK